MAKRQTKCTSRIGNGLAQLSLVEHSLCPLHKNTSLQENLAHQCEYQFTDRQKRRQTAHVKVHCAAGLSSHDEFLLWGMLALTLAQKQPTFDFFITPHYCLRQLGCLSNNSKGGKNYADFRGALRRLSGVTYQNDRFYDPIRREHRSVSFGLLSYSLPIDPNSSRAWRIVWNPLFFEFCQGTGSHLKFDLDTYRSLTCPTRRLFLLLKKVFWCRPVSPVFEVRHLARDIVGFSNTLATARLKSEITRCAKSLLEHDIITLPHGINSVDATFEKRCKGEYSIRFHRGTYFDTNPRTYSGKSLRESAILDPLRAIGFDPRSIARIGRQFDHAQIQVWADVTLAAMERKERGFFRRSPQAFFMDNIKNAAKGRRTPPDWFNELQKEEQRHHAKEARQLRAGKDGPTTDPKTELPLENGHVRFESVVEDMVVHFRSAGQSDEDANRNAQRFAHELERKKIEPPTASRSCLKSLRV